MSQVGIRLTDAGELAVTLIVSEEDLLAVGLSPPPAIAVPPAPPPLSRGQATAHHVPTLAGGRMVNLRRILPPPVELEPAPEPVPPAPVVPPVAPRRRGLRR